MIDKKKLIKCLIIILLIIIIIFTAIQIRNTLARYETNTIAQRDVDVAFWAVDNSFKSQRLVIDDIYPTDTPYEYVFTVSNFDPQNLETDTDDKIAETDMEYDIVLTATTNLPLNYAIEVSKNGVTDTTILAQQKLITDSDGTMYREIKFGTAENPYPLVMDTIDDSTKTKRRITDTFTLKVIFPEQSNVEGELVNNRENLNYPDLIEDIKIDLIARQKID